MISFKNFLSGNGVKEENDAVFFYPNFKSNEYNNIHFSSVNPNFKSIQDINISEPDTQIDSAGVILVEPDGRVWIRKVANNYGGYVYSFAKGRIEDGLSSQQTAIKETFEEMGFLSKIEKFLIDIGGDTTITRFYLGKRIGGHPSLIKQDPFPETDYIVLTSISNARSLLNRSRDKQILSLLEKK